MCGSNVEAAPARGAAASEAIGELLCEIAPALEGAVVLAVMRPPRAEPRERVGRRREE